MLLGLLAKKLPEGLLRSGDLLKKEAPLTVSLIPGGQVWGPISVVSGCLCEDIFPRVALCPQAPAAWRDPGARPGHP